VGGHAAVGKVKKQAKKKEEAEGFLGGMNEGPRTTREKKKLAVICEHGSSSRTRSRRGATESQERSNQGIKEEGKGKLIGRKRHPLMNTV